MDKDCPLCKRWNAGKERWEFKPGKETDWRPTPGTDPRMRQFTCTGCKGIFYQCISRRKAVTEAEQDERKRQKAAADKAKRKRS